MYNAIVAELKNVRPHPNADRLLLAEVFDNTVIVGLNSKTGDKVVYFPCDGQLSEEYANANNLVRKKDPVTGENVGGLFEESRRVKAIKLRGQKSDGYVALIESFDFATKGDHSIFKIGYSFNSINNIPICNKYVVKSRNQNLGKSTKGKKAKKFVETKEEHEFPKHFDTDQLKFYIDRIPAGVTITITEKLHGTSARIGYVPAIRKIRAKGLLGKIANPLLSKFDKHKWKLMHGSRNVDFEGDQVRLNKWENTPFRLDVFNEVSSKLPKGTVVYGEIVGFTSKDCPIMPDHSPSKFGDKEEVKKLTSRYGQTMRYSYGCNEENLFEFYAYRIASINEDGYMVDWSVEQINRFCEENNLNSVPILDRFIYDGNVEELKKKVYGLSEGPSTIDKSHIREGICLRIESLPHPKVYKEKSFTFKVLEGIEKDMGLENLEDQS